MYGQCITPTLGVKARDNKWHWTVKAGPDREICGGRLRELTHWEKRVLGKPALHLWMALERNRDCDGEARPVLKQLADGIGLRYRTAKSALARLRDCGAVTSTATPLRHRREDSSKWTKELRVRVYGAWDHRDGNLRVLLPALTFSAWVVGRAGHGGPRKRRECGFKFAPQQKVTQPCIQYLAEQVGPSFISICTSSTSSLCSLQSQREAQPAASSSLQQGSALHPEAHMNSQSNSALPAELASIDTLAHENPPRTPLPDSEKLYVPARPRHRWRHNSAPQIEREWPTRERVRLLVTEYLHAIRRLYGALPRYMHPGTALPWSQYKALQRAGDEPTTGHLKEFEKLAAAADLMEDEGVIPAHWCEWYLEMLQKAERTDKSGNTTSVWKKRIPPLSVVFSATAIKKRHGWCRRDMRSRTPEVRTLLVSPEEIEANLRIQEIHRINAGWSRAQAISGPRWYVEKREAEIALGHSDPGDFFPRGIDE